MRSFLRSFGQAAKSPVVASSTRRPQTPTRTSPVTIEGLEPRQLMSATVDGLPGCGTGIHFGIIHPPVVGVVVVLHHG